MPPAPDLSEPTTTSIAPGTHGPVAERTWIAAGAALGDALFGLARAIIALADAPDDDRAFEANIGEALDAQRRAAWALERFRECRECAGEA